MLGGLALANISARSCIKCAENSHKILMGWDLVPHLPSHARHMLPGLPCSGDFSPTWPRDVAQAFFRPELLNRLDEVVCFRPLDHAAVRAVTALLAADTASRLLDQRQVRLDVSPGLIDHIAAAGYDQVCTAL